MLRLRISLLVCSLALVALASSVACAETKSEADTQLELFAARLVGSQQFATNIDFAVSVGLPGLTHERSLKYQLVVNRPQQFALNRRGGDAALVVISDGKRLITSAEELGQYTEGEAPESLDAYSDSIEGMMLLPYGMGQLVMSLLDDDPAARLVASSKERKYLGREQIDGIDCYHLRIVEEECDLDVWLTAGPEPKLRRIRPNLSKSFGEEEREMGFAVTISLDFTEWDFAPTIDENTFAFVPPAGSRKVDEIEPIRPEEVLPPVTALHPLIGKQAPAFKLEGLEENDKLDLSEVAGKQVVVLDFWAIFCPSCVEGLPQLEEVAREFKDQPVMFRGVNPYDDAEAIAKFLKEQKLDLPVLIDAEQTVSKNYQARSIPQTVLIGKDGKVHAVYVGLGSDFRQQLKRDITALLKGEDLAARALAQQKGETPADATLPKDPE